ncbi:MAG: hypothetical protein K0R50_2780 [Eubacterium sp.]|nr:hypothetical protein [Eubacterium sp.]
MACYNVMTVLINNRTEHVPEIQHVFTKSGCIIKTRLGIHDAGEDFCSNEGLIILHLIGSDKEILELEESLNKIPGVKAKNTQICSD